VIQILLPIVQAAIKVVTGQVEIAAAKGVSTLQKVKAGLDLLIGDRTDGGGAGQPSTSILGSWIDGLGKLRQGKL
jgi:hypothetical protein